MRKTAFAVIFMFATGAAFAATGEEVLAALETKIKIAHVNFMSGNISAPGTVLVVQKDGLALGKRGGLNKKTVIKNGELVSAGGGTMFGGSSGRQLKPGDKVYLYEDRVNANKDGLTLRILGVDTYDAVDKGHTTQERGDLLIEFYYDKPLAQIDTAAVLNDLSKWLKTEQEASESSTVKLGQTPQEVEAILGAPQKRIDLGAKKVFVYKDMKVVFVDGKVSDVQ